MGGYSSEYKISLISGGVVYDYLDKEKFNAFKIHIFKDKWIYKAHDHKEYNVNRHDFTVNPRQRNLKIWLYI